MRRLAPLLLLALVPACRSQPDDGYAVDLTLTLDGTVSEGDRGSMRTLAIAVTGAERSSMSYPLPAPFADGRSERLIYRPGVTSGSLTFYASARDGGGLDLAGGHASVDLVPAGTAFVTVVLSRVLGPPGDGGTDGSNGDGAVASCGPGDDGRICGAGDLCHDPPTCFGGLCVPNLKGDGTTCGTAPDTCHGPPRCTAGSCGAAPPVGDGTACGLPDSCHGQPTCTSGVCGTAPQLPDGTVCNMTADPCKSSGTCAGGVCGAVGNRADGTSCGTAPDTCHNAPVCKTGACQAAAAKADGTVCLTTANPCQNPGTCKTGVCGPITNADGKVCSNPVDSCHTPGVCMSGMCGAQGTLGQGVSWDGQYQHRCCAGVPVDISTDAANCGGCGIACRNGNACQHVGTAVNAYYCRCTVATDCWSSCCSLGTAYPNTPMVCAASTCPEPGACIACTGQTCALDGANSAYCHY